MSGRAEGERAASGSSHKHDQVRREIQRLARELGPGEALPGERQLEQRYGVSRITVRRAVSDLVAAGVLARVHGKGTFVTHGQVRSRLHLASFHEDMRAAGLEPATQVLDAGLQPAPEDPARWLGVEPGEPLCRMRRLRLASGTPMSVDECWLPAVMAERFEGRDLTRSLYGILSEVGTPVLHAEQVVAAKACTPQMAGWLQIQEGEPVLEFRRESSTRELDSGAERPIEYSISTYRADRYQLSMHVE